MAMCRLPALALFVCGLVTLSGCDRGVKSETELACDSSPKLNLTDMDSISQDSRQRALFGIEQVWKVESKAKSAWFGTGALSESLGKIGGTEAISVRAETKMLSQLVANQKAVELALSIGGNSPLPGNASWACETLAVSVASLDTRQSDEQFLRNLKVVEAYFRTVYETNGGQDLDARLASSKAAENQQ